MYEGKYTLDNISAFHFAMRWHFKNVAQAIEWVRTSDWGQQVVLQGKENAAVWAMHRFPMTMPIKWCTFCM